MCETCGCSLPRQQSDHHHHDHQHRHAHGVHDHDHGHGNAAGSETLEVLKGLMSANDRAAAHNRAHFDRAGVLAINLMSSPGAGKTRLLERTAEALGDRFRIAVIEGDLETENDAERLRAGGIRAHQITTGSACHLDAHLVHDALHDFPLEHDGLGTELLFIENVGNLVCPAAFDLGQHLNVVLLSTTEGDDKPAKYPVMFRAADLVVISKADLLPLLDDFSVKRAEQSLRQLGVETPLIRTACGRETELDEWIAWLEARLGDVRSGETAATV